MAARDLTRRSPRRRVPWWSHALAGWVTRHPRQAIALGDLESRLLRERLDAVPLRAPVYVAGLARAGTTIVLELLARHPELASHRYRDFPLLTLPWAWNWFVDRAGGRPPPAEERAHGDGIVVTRESPEAFEEMLWLAFFPPADARVAGSRFGRERREPAFERFYLDHLRKLLLVRGRPRYLAKANYHLTRLPWLHARLPDARFVLPLRDPVRHVASLMRQQARFAEPHRRDPRARAHMARSGHFEFGLDRRPAPVGSASARQQVIDLWREGSRAAEVEGWARYWSLVHEDLHTTLAADAPLADASLVLRHETLASQPVETLQRVFAHCALGPAPALLAHAADTVRAPYGDASGFDAGERALIRHHTREAYERLAARAGPG